MAHDATAALAQMEDHLVALLGIPDGGVDALCSDVQVMIRAVERSLPVALVGSFVGISREVTSPAALPEAHEQATKAASFGSKISGPLGVCTFDSLGVFRLLCLISDEAELTSYVRETLGPLAPTGATGDDHHLLKTLTVFLESGMNAAQAARALHFHYNTLRYRVDKLERLLGPFTTDSDLRLRIQLALKILTMDLTHTWLEP